VTSSFMDYLIPTAETLPSFALDQTVTTTPTNPLGAKGIGEAGAIGSTPAVLNAVSDALDGADVQVPVKPEQIWKALNRS
jgi:carbon-monoxide dehydrogenase large subunit